LLAACAAICSSTAIAQTPSQAPAAQSFPGTIRLAVDATDVTRHVFRVTETIPVKPGALTLLYPKWIPGHHSPVGRIDSLAGLIIQANGQRVEWRRDPVDVYAFHVDVPQGASSLDVAFQFLSAGDGNEGRIVTTPDMLNLQWSSVALYPDFPVRQINIEASVVLPEGWDYATALDTTAARGSAISFQPVSFETLVDSPLYAGRYVKHVDLAATPVPVRLNIFADHADLLEAKPEYLEAHRALVAQANKLFNAHHYDHYDFLLALSDRLGVIGLEHHRSSENGTAQTYFTEWDKNVDTRMLLPHEYAHSWCGKFRRPADLTTADYRTPMQDSLLWVYEGQTEYWGYVLSARAGLLTKEQALDALAHVAAVYQIRPGREWKSLQDTTNDPIIADRRPIPWRSWQRSEDYYSEGELLWLDADTLIRELSGGQKSLDDFARAFFGVDDGKDDGKWEPKTYTFDDVVKTLNAVEPHDWAGFLRARLDGHGGAPLDGLARGGYTLTFTETPSDFFKKAETRRKINDLTFSLGFTVGHENKLSDVLWGGPAHAAGLTVGTQIIAVDSIAYNADRLKEIVKLAKGNTSPIELLVKNGDRYATVRIDYHRGLRYPHLQRDAGASARLDDILAAKK
jgi:predicted metalloprotease with PDZ domain